MRTEDTQDASGAAGERPSPKTSASGRPAGPAALDRAGDAGASDDEEAR